MMLGYKRLFVMAFAVLVSISCGSGADLSDSESDEETEPDLGRWSAMREMPVAKNKIFVFGGSSSSTFSSLVYNAGDQSWKALESLPSPSSFLGATALGDSVVFVLGGGPANLNRFDALNFTRKFSPPK